MPALLEGIGSQGYRDFETVVVDSGSYDRTRDIAKQHCDRLLRIDSRDFTYGYSLNVGIEASKGRYVVLVSAHTEPVDDSWLGNLITPLGDATTAMTFGKQIGGGLSRFSDVQDLGRTFGSERQLMTPPHYFAHNANSAIRRDLWASHRFDEVLPGLEDIAWAKYWMERGYNVIYEPSAAIYHGHDESWPRVRRRYHAEAVALRMIGLAHRSRLPFELAREAQRLLGDLFRAARASDLRSRFSEIVLYRLNRGLGTAKGLLDGAVPTDPDRRAAMFFDRTHLVAVMRGPGDASIEEIDIPRVKPGDVLVRVAYAGVRPSDFEVLDGKNFEQRGEAALYPVVPGHEFSGRVVVMGAKVRHLDEGDLVVGRCFRGCGDCVECQRGNETTCTERGDSTFDELNGPCARYVVVPGRFVHRLPSESDLDKACLSEPLAVVVKGLRRLSYTPPQRQNGGKFAVVGAGPLGHLCARVLALQGHQVTVFDRNPQRRAYFEGTSIGVHSSENLERLVDFDVLVEAAGDPGVLDKMLHHSAAGATILLLGLPYANERYTFKDIVAYDKTVVGSVGSSHADFEEAVRLLPQLELDARLQHIVAFSDFQEAPASVRRGEHLKTLIEMDPEWRYGSS